MTDRTRRETDVGPAATRREDGSAAGPTRLEGEATQGRASGPSAASRTFVLPAALVEHGFTHVERLSSRGAEASLHLVNDREGRSYVLKAYHSGAPKTEILERLRALNTRYVNPLYWHGETEVGFCELQAWAPEGSLRDLIQREGTRLPPEFIEEVLRELGSALAELHSQDIEHRDLKPENILLGSRNPIRLMLIDFGIASVVEGSMHATSASRTTYYAPPEAFSGIFRKECWDYWSLGIILVELLTGRHPFAGLSEQVVMHRLMTLNPDDFVAGVADARWKLLCRGLLRRAPEKRWGSAQVDRWLRRDATLTVADEAGTGQAAGTPSPAFLGERFPSPEDLAVKLATNWSTAVQYWKSSGAAIKNWVLHELGRKDIAERLDAVDRENVGAEGELFRVIKALDPTLPPIFDKIKIDLPGLTALVVKAAGKDQEALSTIAALQKERILTVADMQSQPAQLASVDAAWRREMQAYSSLASSLSTHVRNASSLTLTPAASVLLLGSVLPDTPLLANLRQDASKAASRDARACKWFRDLGETSTAPPSALVMMPLVASQAEAVTAAERQARSDANWRIVGNLFKYGSIPVLILMWIIYYNSPGQVAARQEEARRVEMARQQQERARLEQIRQQQEAARERERARQAEIERRARCTNEGGSEYCCPSGMLPVSQMAADYSRRLFCCPPNAKTMFVINPQDLLRQGCQFVRQTGRGLFR